MASGHSANYSIAKVEAIALTGRAIAILISVLLGAITGLLQVILPILR